MIEALASLLVLLAGLYLLGLGVVSLADPARATRFLLGFAGSARAHYLELALRLAVGAAFIWRAPHLLFPGLFSLFGWVLAITTAGLFLVPWRWHQRFAQSSVPHALRHLRLLGIASLALGGFVLLAAARGPA